MNLTRFIKIMMLTTSPEGNEALSAVRQANGILKKENMTWETFLMGQQEHEAPRQRKQYRKTYDEYDQTREETWKPKEKKRENASDLRLVRYYCHRNNISITVEEDGMHWIFLDRNGKNRADWWIDTTKCYFNLDRKNSYYCTSGELISLFSNLWRQG